MKTLDSFGGVSSFSASISASPELVMLCSVGRDSLSLSLLSLFFPRRAKFVIIINNTY